MARSSPGPSTTSAPASALPISRPSVRASYSAAASVCFFDQPNLNPFSTPSAQRWRIRCRKQPGGPARSPVSQQQHRHHAEYAAFPLVRPTIPPPTTTLLHQPQSAPRLYLQLQLQCGEGRRLKGRLHLRLRRFASRASKSQTSTSTRPLWHHSLGTAAQNATRPFGKLFPNTEPSQVCVLVRSPSTVGPSVGELGWSRRATGMRSVGWSEL